MAWYEWLLAASAWRKHVIGTATRGVYNHAIVATGSRQSTESRIRQRHLSIYMYIVAYNRL